MSRKRNQTQGPIQSVLNASKEPRLKGDLDEMANKINTQGQPMGGKA